MEVKINTCIESGERQSVGSSEMILTVLSAKPTAKNRERCSPEGTEANAMQMTWNEKQKF